jgi:putative tricarboxylic transport membrane protein
MRRVVPGELAFALGVVGLGLFFAFETTAIPVTPVYSRIGPRVFPIIVSAGLILIGLLLVRDALAGCHLQESGATEESRETNWLALTWMSLGLALNVVLMERAGFVLASSLLFWLTARGFGSRRPLRDAAIAILLCTVVYLGFTRGLDLPLPAGILKGVF